MKMSFEERFNKRISTNLKHAENGVIIINPENTYIDEDVKIGQGTIIYPNNFLEGSTIIGENCNIGPNNRITNSILCDEVNVQYSVINDSEIGNATVIGPFAYIRPGSKIGEHSKIGDFVEIKNSNIGDYSKVPHLTYVGDADVGNKVNMGCGSITVNYDGKNKFRTVIEDEVFIGCNSNLVAPVIVKKGSYVAAGSTITKEVPEKSMAIARAHQVNKENWVRPYEK